MRPPSSSVASAARRSEADGNPSRSAATKSARPPAATISPTTAAPRSALRPLTITCAPSAPKASAIARPMLLVAPVTSAPFPSSRSAIAAACHKNGPTGPISMLMAWR